MLFDGIQNTQTEEPERATRRREFETAAPRIILAHKESERGDLEQLAEEESAKLTHQPSQTTDIEIPLMIGYTTTRETPGAMYANHTPVQEGMYRNTTHTPHPPDDHSPAYSSNTGCNGCEYHP